MGLSDSLREPVVVKRLECQVAILIRHLSPEDAEALQEAFDDPSRPVSFINAALAQNGYEIGPSSLSRHRRGYCRCRR